MCKWDETHRLKVKTAMFTKVFHHNFFRHFVEKRRLFSHFVYEKFSGHEKTALLRRYHFWNLPL